MPATLAAGNLQSPPNVATTMTTNLTKTTASATITTTRTTTPIITTSSSVPGLATATAATQFEATNTIATTVNSNAINCGAVTGTGTGTGAVVAGSATTLQSIVKKSTISSALAASSSSSPSTTITTTSSAASLQQFQASREDITSLGGASSVNSQLSLTNSNINNNNNNNNNGGYIGCTTNNNTKNNNNNNNSNNSSSNIGNNNGNINSNGVKTNNHNNNNNNNYGHENKENTFYNGTGSGSAGSIEGGSITGGGAGGSISSRNTDNDDPGDDLGPLPSKWETAYTERGEVYFIDHNTGTSHWLDPRLSKFQKKSLEDCGDNELPYGWEKIQDSLYGTYYIDHVNRRTQYENPVLEAKRRAAEQNQQQHHPQNERTQTPTMSSQSPSCFTAGKICASSSSTTLDRRPMHPPPPPEFKPPSIFPYKFTRNPAEMQGERLTTTLVKSSRGLGIKIVGGDDGIEEFLQIKSIVPHGPAWQDGQLQSGDVLVYVNDTCVLGFTHLEMVNVFQSILPGETVTLEVCRGYPLPFDPNDPNTEVVTTIAVDQAPEKQHHLLMDYNMNNGNLNFLNLGTSSLSIPNDGGNKATTAGGQHHPHQHAYHPKTSDGFILMRKPEVHTFTIVKGAMGFGFTIADSGFGQKVKKILDRSCCTHLQEGDVLLEINDVSVRSKTHLEVVQMLKECSKATPTVIKIQRAAGSTISGTAVGSSLNMNSAISPNGGSVGLGGGVGVGTKNVHSGNVAKLRKNFIGNTSTGLFRSKTPTAEIYSTQQKEILPMRPKTPLVDTRRARVKTPNNELNDAEVAAVTGGGDVRSFAGCKSQVDAKSTNSLQEIDVINQDIPFMDPYPKLVTSLSERLAEANLREGATNSRLGYHVHAPLRTPNYENQEYVTASNHSGSYNPIYGLTTMPPPLQLNPNTFHQQLQQQHHQPHQFLHADDCNCYDCQDYRGVSKFPHQTTQPYYGSYQTPTIPSQIPTLGNYTTGASLQQQQHQATHIQNERIQKRLQNDFINERRRVGFSPLDAQLHAQTSPPLLPSGYTHHQQPSPAISSVSQQLQHQQQYQQQRHPQQSWLSSTLPPTTTPDALVNPHLLNLNALRNGLPLDVSDDADQFELSEVTLERQALGFGFRIVGGTEEGSQVTVGHIVVGGAADNDHRINTGDEILSIDGVNVVNASHQKVVSLMGEAALRGRVSMIMRRRLNSLHQNQYGDHLQQQILPHNMLPPTTNFGFPQEHQQQISIPLALCTPPSIRYPYDVIVSRHENEGFGFVIISSSNQYYGSTIGKLIPGSPADRSGELKVGDRIIAVNRVDIAGMSHGEVVNLIKESGLHVRLTIGSPSEVVSNVMQASPGQHSQSQLSQISSQHTTADNTSLYFERPNMTQQANQQQTQQ